MKCSPLPQNILSEIVRFAEKYGIGRVILFGSRARGANRERSDVDLLAEGGDVDGFRFALDEEAETLLSFDVVDGSSNPSEELKSEIQKDGIQIYEKI